MFGSTRDPEGVYTFGEFTERFYAVFILWADLLVGLYQDFKRDFNKILEALGAMNVAHGPTV